MQNTGKRALVYGLDSHRIYAHSLAVWDQYGTNGGRLVRIGPKRRANKHKYGGRLVRKHWRFSLCLVALVKLGPM